MLHVARGWVHFTDASEARTIAEPEYVTDDIPTPHKGDGGIAPSSVGTENASLYNMGIMEIMWIILGGSLVKGFTFVKGFILDNPTFFVGLVGRIVNEHSNSKIIANIYNIFPRFRYTHTIKYAPLSFNDILKTNPIEKHRHITMSLRRAIKENQLGIVKTLINYSVETNNNTNYIVDGSIYFRNKAHYNQLRSFLRTAEKKGLHKIRDYLIYRHISYALKTKDFNVATFYFKRYNDIINYDDGLLSQEVITMIDNAVEKNNDEDLKSALDRLHFLIKKEHNLNIHVRDNLITSTLIRYGHKESCKNHLVNIINDYKNSFDQQNFQSMDFLFDLARSTYNDRQDKHSSNQQDSSLRKIFQRPLITSEQSCKDMYIKVTTMHNKDPHTSLIPHPLFPENIYERLQHAITLLDVDHVKNISHHMSSMKVLSHEIGDITSKLKNALVATEKDLRDLKEYKYYVQIEKYIYHTLIILNISHRNQKQIKSLLDENIIDINYKDGAVLKRLLSEQRFSEKDTPDDYPFIETLIQNHDLNIHAQNNLLFNHAVKHKKINLLKFLMSQCTKILPNNLLYDIKNVFVQYLAKYINENKWEEVKLLLDTKIIDINYKDGAVLKKLLPEQHHISEKDIPDDYQFIETLIQNHGLDIHVGNNFLLHAMISREQISMLRYIIEEGWETFVLNKEDNTLDKLYWETSGDIKTGGDKYNNKTYRYLEEVYIVRSAQYRDSFFHYGYIRPQPISNMLFEQAINMAMRHSNISYFKGLINFQKEQCGGEDKFYKKFNDFLMGLVKPETLNIIFIRGQGALFEELLLNDLILYNTKIKDVSNVRYIIPHIHNIETLRKCIKTCLMEKEDKDDIIICNLAQWRIRGINYHLESTRDKHCERLIYTDIEKIVNIQEPKDRDVQELRLLCQHYLITISESNKLSPPGYFEHHAYILNEYANKITISNKGNTNSNKDKMKSILLASELVIRSTLIGMYKTEESMIADFEYFKRCDTNKLTVAIDALEKIRALLASFRNAMMYNKVTTTTDYIKNFVDNLSAEHIINDLQEQINNLKHVIIIMLQNNDNEQSNYEEQSNDNEHVERAINNNNQGKGHQGSHVTN